MHRSACLLAFAGVTFLANWASAQEESSPQERVETIRIVQTQKVRSGTFERRQITTSRATAVDVSSLRVATDRVSFRLVTPSKSSAGGSSLVRFGYDERALAVFTGGFLDTFSPATPAGLVQQHNKIKNDLLDDDKVMKAVVCYSVDSINPAVIMTIAEFLAGKPKGDCIQTGPFLAKNGKQETNFDELEKSLKNAPFARGSFQRAFVSVNTSDEIAIGIAAQISLFALREVLLKSVQEGGFGAVVAVALSGGTTAGLVIEDGNRRITAGTVKTLLPNAVVIRER